MDCNIESLTVIQLRSVAKNMELKGYTHFNKSDLCEFVKKERDRKCIVLNVNIAEFKFGTFYRIRSWNQTLPPDASTGPLFFTITVEELYLVAKYKAQNHPKGPEEGSKQWKTLIVDQYEINGLELIYMDFNWNYKNLEKEIRKIDSSYTKGIGKQPKGKIPDGDNFVPANWLSEKTCYDGWLETRESNSFMNEVMLTPSGFKKLKYVQSRNIIDILDEAFQQ
jgi:hypothetical protein